MLLSTTKQCLRMRYSFKTPYYLHKFDAQRMIWQEGVKTSEEEALELYIITKYDSP
jgi:hypothetical protein